MAYIEMQHCYKRYTSGETEIFANQDVSFSDAFKRLLQEEF